MAPTPAPSPCAPASAAPLNASTSISIARSVFGRIKIVAASVPLRTHAWPVFGIPSHPVIGIFIQRARSLSGISLNAFRAPMAMLSSCAPTRSMWLSCEVSGAATNSPSYTRSLRSSSRASSSPECSPAWSGSSRQFVLSPRNCSPDLRCTESIRHSAAAPQIAVPESCPLLHDRN